MCCAEVVRRVMADRRRDDDMLPLLILNLEIRKQETMIVAATNCLPMKRSNKVVGDGVD